MPTIFHFNHYSFKSIFKFRSMMMKGMSPWLFSEHYNKYITIESIVYWILHLQLQQSIYWTANLISRKISVSLLNAQYTAVEYTRILFHYSRHLSHAWNLTVSCKLTAQKKRNYVRLCWCLMFRNTIKNKFNGNPRNCDSLAKSVPHSIIN